MTFGAEIWGPMLIQAGASAASGYLSNKGQAGQETKMERTKRKLVDQLINSLTGEGPFSDLYNTNQDVFQKSFIEPAQAMFRNQVAPQIQQQFIASGQQRGTGLEDTLTRAGVDLDSMLNQYLYQSQQDAQNRSQNTISSIFGVPAGAKPQSTGGQDVMSALSGYLSGPEFGKSSGALWQKYGPQQPERKGFETQL